MCYKAKVYLVKEESFKYDCQFLNEYDIRDFLIDKTNLAMESEEVVLLIALDTKNRPVNYFEVSRGSVDVAILHPREIFKRLLLSNATSFVIAHNHPSGNLEPSQEDIKTCKDFRELGNLMQIELLDSIIINANEEILSIRSVIL